MGNNTSSASTSYHHETSKHTHSSGHECKACTGNDNDIHYTNVSINNTPTSTSHQHDTHQVAPCIAYAESGCPLTRAEVGRCTWAYLHTIAAWYPQPANKYQQDRMRDYM